MTVPTVEAAPAYRPFTASAVHVQRLTPSFVRVTFGGADLDEFASGGLDQRIKVLFPLPGRGLVDARRARTGTASGGRCRSIGATRSAPTPSARRGRPS